MRITQLLSLAALITMSLSLGCAMPDSFGFAKKSKPPTPSFAPGPATPKPQNSMMAAVTDNPVSRGVSGVYKETAELLTIKPRAKNKPDVLSMDSKLPTPTPELYNSMAEVQAKSGTSQQALDFYHKALELDPTNLDANLGLAHLHDRDGQLDTAANFYALAVQQHPNSARARNDLGLCLARQGKYPQATTLLESAVQIAPEKELYRNNLATVYVETGRTEDALRHLSAAHSEAIAHYNLGYLLHQRGQDGAAAEHFAQAVAADPQLVQAQAMLASLNVGPAAQPKSGIAVSPAQATQQTAQADANSQDRVSLRVPTRELPTQANTPPAPESSPQTIVAQADSVNDQRYLLSPSTPLPDTKGVNTLTLQQPQYRGPATVAEAPSPESVNFYRASAAPEKLPPVGDRY